jgi:hypothetical protein
MWRGDCGWTAVRLRANGEERAAMAGYPLKDDELEGIRRRLADVLSCDDAVRLLGHVDYLRNELTKIQKRQMQAWEDEADVFNEMTRKG